ncbi:MAG: hypothetical protein NTY73_04030 [Candidatus Micrarchaeota archaeon]|nr:hypothetical protein [Candidatus Micrarchaeota archaeon]
MVEKKVRKELAEAHVKMWGDPQKTKKEITSEIGKFGPKSEKMLQGQTFAGYPVEHLGSTTEKENTGMVMLKAGVYQIILYKETPEEAKAVVNWWNRGILGLKENSAEYIVKDLIENIAAFGKIYGDFSNIKSPKEVMKAVKLAADVNSLYRSEPVRELFRELEEDRDKKSMPNTQK